MFATTTIKRNDKYIDFTFELKDKDVYQTDGIFPSFFYLSFKCKTDDELHQILNNESRIEECDIIDITYHDKGIVLSNYTYQTFADPSDFSTYLDKITLGELYRSSHLIKFNDEETRQEGKKFIKLDIKKHDKIIKRLYMDRGDYVTLVIARLLNGKLHSFGVPSLSVAEVNFVEIPFEETIKSGLMSYKYFTESRYYDGEFLSSFTVSDDYDDIGHDFNESDIELYVNRNANFDIIPEGTKVRLTRTSSRDFISQLKKGIVPE